MSRKSKKAIDDNQLCTVQFTCPNCGKIHYLKGIPEKDYKRSLFRRSSGEYIQDIFPYLSKRDREKFITGYCNECQKDIFGDPEQ